ncbi:MAG: hypothetical protein IJV67_06600 [Clostridia bacterium]|nr:hypothetical protein [Clostridia bacterium]
MKKFVVISHTHWDREWYMTFECFRLRLVDLVDRLLDIIEGDSNYIFHLDAQTVVLEDYLELRPYNEERLRSFVRSGNLIIGPWYLQNDFYLSSGESTVRNLQIGTAIAEDFGRCSRVGHAPDQFGNVSQLPQILKSFDIDSFIFGRGFSHYETVDGERRPAVMPTEFIWVGADGTEALAVHLKHWYNNAQHMPEEIELSELILTLSESNFEGLNVSPYVLLMNGVDHLEAQADILDVISKLRQKGYDISQKSLDNYVSDVKQAVNGKELFRFKGALNYGDDYSVLKGCWSSRIYLKRRNVQAEDLLINNLEPLYSYLELNGFKGLYPTCELNYLWKKLLKNQTHDCICGCSVDDVHYHMEDRYSRVEELGKMLLERGMKTLALHSVHSLADEKKYLVAVFNPTQTEQTAVVQAAMNFTENVDSLAVYGADGEQIPYEIVEVFNRQYDVFSPVNLPGVLDVNTHVIRFVAKSVPAFSSAIYAVVINEEGCTIEKKCRKTLENDKYCISVCNGELHIENKISKEKYVNPILLEDCVDRGDAYVYRKSSDVPMIIKPGQFVFKDGELKQSLEFSFEYVAPAEYDFEALALSDAQVTERVECSLSIDRVSDVISLSYKIINKRKDHRLRLLVESGIRGGAIATDSVFDFDERKPYESCDITESNTHFAATFSEVFVGNRALSAYTEGQHEVAYEEGRLAITILRCTGVINRSPDTFSMIGGETWRVDGNQCVKDVEGRIGFAYGGRKGPAKNYTDARMFRTGLLVHADSFDSKKYSGGRFAVQSSRLEKLYYLPDKYSNCKVSLKPSFTLAEGRLSVTCYKKGLFGGYIVRLVNLTDEIVKDEFLFEGSIYLTDMSERESKFLGYGQATLTLVSKQILTLRIENEKA